MAIDYFDSTSLNISWTLADDETVTGYSNSDTISGIAASEISHTLTDLEEGTEHTIAVTAQLTGKEIL